MSFCRLGECKMRWVYNEFKTFSEIVDGGRSKKNSLVSGNRPGKSWFYHSPARIVECVSEYIFFSKKSNQKKQKTKEQNEKTKKCKETKEEKRISMENLKGYDDIVCEFALCTFNLLNRVVNIS